MRSLRLAHPPLVIITAVIGLAALAGAAPAAAARVTSHDNSAVVPATAYGVAAATQLSDLPYLEQKVEAGGQSSFDRDTFDATHGNLDFRNFLATGARGNVMLDQRGTGCVYRIWMTSLQSVFPHEWVKVYFDGAAKPAIDLTIAQMFSGVYAPFLVPAGAGPLGVKRRLHQLRAAVLPLVH